MSCAKHTTSTGAVKTFYSSIHMVLQDLTQKFIMLCTLLQERRWFFIRNGKASDYHGPAVHWRHLSRWERHVGKVHLQYDPAEDLRQRREANLYNRISVHRPVQDIEGKLASNGDANGYKLNQDGGSKIEE